MFEPGHLHLDHLADGSGHAAYRLDLHYSIASEAQEGAMLQVTLQGEVQGKTFEETFQLHRDSAFNVVGVAGRLAAKHGLSFENGLLMSGHADFEALLEDIRQRFERQSGECIDFAHFDKDRL